MAISIYLTQSYATVDVLHKNRRNSFLTVTSHDTDSNNDSFHLNIHFSQNMIIHYDHDKHVHTTKPYITTDVVLNYVLYTYT